MKSQAIKILEFLDCAQVTPRAGLPSALQAAFVARIVRGMLLISRESDSGRGNTRLPGRESAPYSVCQLSGRLRYARVGRASAGRVCAEGATARSATCHRRRSSDSGGADCLVLICVTAVSDMTCRSPVYRRTCQRKRGAGFARNAMQPRSPGRQRSTLSVFDALGLPLVGLDQVWKPERMRVAQSASAGVWFSVGLAPITTKSR